MKQVWLVCLVIALSAASAFAADLPPRLILTLDDDAAAVARDTGALPAAVQSLNLSGASLVPVFHLPNDADKLASFRNIGLHRYFRLEADGMNAAAMVDDVPLGDEILRAELAHEHTAHITPNDYTIYDMWGLTKMEMPAAWDIHHDADSPVIVSTIDTGCTIDHEDLAANMWVNPGEDLNNNGVWDPSDNNNIDDDANGFVDDLIGYDFVSHNPTGTPADGEEYAPRDNLVYPDIHGHGTHVMGSAAGVTDNGVGVAAASWNVRAMPLRAGFAWESWMGLMGSGYADDFADAINYAVNNGARVISISFGGSSYEQFYQDAVTYARDNNVILFASAGNNDNSNMNYPAAYDGAIAVAATDQSDHKASFSTYGTWVGISAPGVSIWSTMSNNNYHNYDYINWDGTSMASPNAAAVAGLLLSYDPDLTDDEVEAAILNSADDIDGINPGYAGQLGAGRINAFQALAELGYNDNWPPASDLTADLDTDNGTVSLAWTAPNVLSQQGTGGVSNELPQVGQDLEALTASKDGAAVQARRQARDAYFESHGEQNGSTPAKTGQDGNVIAELDEFLHYQIYRDGDPLTTTTNTSYTDNLPDFGLYSYTVTAVYDDGESLPTNAEVVNWIDMDGYALLENFDAGLPDTWTVEGSLATLNWHVDFGGERGLFPTPYMLVDSDAPGSCPHIMARLVTPPMDLSDNDQVTLNFSHVFNEYVEEIGDVDVRVQDGPWETVATFEDDLLDPVDESIDVSAQLAGAGEGWISFYYDDLGNWGWYWGIDDVDVYAPGGNAGPATFDVTGINTQVPASGGTVTYSVEIIHNTGNTYTGVNYWTMLVLPNGNDYGPVFQTSFNLNPFAEIFVPSVNQNVPAAAPAGSYEHISHIGFFPNPQLSDSFIFEKMAAGTDDAPGEMSLEDWTVSGFDVNDGSAPVNVAEMPGEFSLSAAYPNPFNPTTEVTVALPETAELMVSVYNVAGQRVAVLASGEHAAGTHQLTFDATGMASGLYFVRAQSGQFDVIQKVTLMK